MIVNILLSYVGFVREQLDRISSAAKRVRDLDERDFPDQTAPGAPPTIIYCQECMTGNPSDNIACRKCAALLHHKKSSTCSKCGKSNTIDKLFCTRCGERIANPLNDNLQATIGEQPVDRPNSAFNWNEQSVNNKPPLEIYSHSLIAENSNRRFCKNCGTVNPDERMYCKKCFSPLGWRMGDHPIDELLDLGSERKLKKGTAITSFLPTALGTMIGIAIALNKCIKLLNDFTDTTDGLDPMAIFCLLFFEAMIALFILAMGAFIGGYIGYFIYSIILFFFNRKK